MNLKFSFISVKSLNCQNTEIEEQSTYLVFFIHMNLMAFTDILFPLLQISLPGLNVSNSTMTVSSGSLQIPAIIENVRHPYVGFA